MQTGRLTAGRLLARQTPVQARQTRLPVQPARLPRRGLASRQQPSPQRDLALLLARCQAERDPEAELVTEAPSTSQPCPAEPLDVTVEAPDSFSVPEAGPGLTAQAPASGLWPSWATGTLLAAAPLFAFGGSTGGFKFPGGTVASVLALASIITIHEAGHFFAARTLGVHIQEFSVGVGPTLLKRKGKDILYSLRALPLAGYVAFPDNDPKSKIPKDDPNLLKNRGILDRAIVLSAGVVANTIFAWSILFAQANVVGMVDAVYQPGVLLGGMEKATSQARSLLHAGDVVTAVDGLPLKGRKGDVSALVNAITRHPEHDIVLDVQRSGLTSRYTLQPELDAKGDGRLGLHLASNVKYRHTKATGLPDAAMRANGALVRCFSQVLGGFKTLFSNFGGAASTLSGPVGVVAAGADAAKQDPAGLYQYAALINVNLAVVNLLPLPALDGGYLILLVLEALRGKKLSKVLEQNLVASGVLLFASLSLFLIVRDTINLGGL